MSTSEIQLHSSSGAPIRKKRRPPLACEPCRRKKVRCDRQNPCVSCAKSKEACVYVQDDRRSLTKAPFAPADTHLSVFNQAPVRPSDSSKETGLEKIEWSSDEHREPTYSPSSSSTGNHSSPILTSSDPRTRHVEMKPFGLTLDTSGLGGSPISQLPPVRTPSVGGFTYKGKFYGESHWMNYTCNYTDILSFLEARKTVDSSPGSATFAMCKALGRTIKARESTVVVQPLKPIQDLVPTRAVANRLVQAYLRTFQAVFGILETKAFYEDYKGYWSDQRSVPEIFVATLLLVMSIGAAVSSNEVGVSRAQIIRWICYSHAWLDSFSAKARPTFDALRAHCLLFLARQTQSMKADAPWLSTGLLLRMAMQMNLHLDCSRHPSSNRSTSEVQARRRLWAAVVELELQSSMDCGAIPSIDVENYDYAVPFNIDEMPSTMDSADSSPVSQPPNHFTQSSIQILLARTIPVRLKIARFVNSSRSKDSLETAMELSKELTAALARCHMLIEDYCMSSRPPTSFQTKCFDLLVRRFLLGLHHPFVVRPVSDSFYHYSRKVCLDTSLALFSDMTQPALDDFHHLLLSGAGMIHHVYTRAALYLCGALDLSESDWLFTAGGPRQIRKAVDHYLELNCARLARSEKSVKYHALISAILARADARQMGTSVDQSVELALTRSLDLCYSLLKTQLQSMQHTSLAPWDISEVTAPSFDPIDTELDFSSSWNDLVTLDMSDLSREPVEIF